MTPLQLIMMLHYYTTPRPYAENEPEHAGSVAVKEQRGHLLDSGLLEMSAVNTSGFKMTDKGNAYVAHLCAVQVPICKWVQPGPSLEGK